MISDLPPPPSPSQPWSKADLLGRKRLSAAAVFSGPERGFGNTPGRIMSFVRCRFNPYALRVSRPCSRSRHDFLGKLFEGANVYDSSGVSDRSKLLRKVSALMGYDDFHDIIKNEEALKESDGSHKHPGDDSDISLVCKRFPSISLGSSPPLPLYNDAGDSPETSGGLVAEAYEFLPKGVSVQWEYPEDGFVGSWPATCSPSSVESSTSEELEDENLVIDSKLTEEELKEYTSDAASTDSRSPNFQVEEKIVPEVSKDSSSHGTWPESKINSALLDESIICLPGLTKRQCSQLEDSGFHTLRKLLHHFPRTYADLRNAQAGIGDGQYVASVGEIISSRGVKASLSFAYLEVIVSCDILDDKRQHLMDDGNGSVKKTIYLHLKKYFRGTRFTNQGFLNIIQSKHKLGDIVCVTGKVKTVRSENHFEMIEFNIDVLGENKNLSFDTGERPYPIYPSKRGLKPDFLRSIISRAVQTLPPDVDPVPELVIREFNLPLLHDAFNGIHRPNSIGEADLARKRLIFDEFLYIQLGRLYQMLEGVGTLLEKEGVLDKCRKPVMNAVHMDDWSDLTRSFFHTLPYSLTPSQLGAISEIIWDLKQPVPMNRLLQGDVGCGKTVVAFLACMEVIGSGYQAALMVPTELLAIQHYEHLLKMLGKMEDNLSKPSVALLTGSKSAKEKQMIREDIRNGATSMVIGTTSLISEKLEFSNLRITVVDEQHLFGVIQRGRFNSKLFVSSSNSRTSASSLDESPKVDGYMAPHVLAMSATPIPRTLALALYGDMSLTQITDLPPGRIPVETYVKVANSDGYEDVYRMMREELEVGGRIYLVYPVIEQSEQLPQLHAASSEFEAISNRFQGYNCGLLHGRMKGIDKDEALRSFRSGDTRILLSTQIVEIGVDIPEASMMVVMNAERFGMAQLHQFRGRVGRGARKSKCIFLAASATSLDRLRFLEKSSDGFYLANMDLLVRGPGDLLGKKQSGHLPEFPIARIEMDGNILQEAHAAALKILGHSHDLEKYPALKAELSMRQPLSLLGD